MQCSGSEILHTQDQESQPAVRFASVNEEIEPTHSLQAPTTEGSEGPELSNEISPEAQEQLRSISKSLNQSYLQQSRMCNFAFEPVSLPATRVCLAHPAVGAAMSLGVRQC